MFLRGCIDHKERTLSLSIGLFQG